MKYWAIVALSIVVTAFGGVDVFADVNDFTISNFKSEMTLEKDSEGRSTLRTVETITAEFPEIDQNRGLERAIPKSYDGHSTNVAVESVKDETGADRTHSTYGDDNGNLVVRMADMNVYVHGSQTYVLTYTQRDVTRYFQDTGSDEFYWDINGTDWRVPIKRLDTTLTIDPNLVGSLSGKNACYQGIAGSTDRCELARSGNVFRNTATELARGENVTLAIGFKPDTFAAYQMTLMEKIMLAWGMLQGALFFVIGGIVTWLGVRLHRLMYRTKELEPIPPEYLPPKNVSVTAASQVAKQPATSVMTAQLLDLAVRHYIKLYEVKPAKWYGAGEYEIEIVQDVGGLRQEEKELLKDMFNRLPAPGDRINLKSLQNNMAYYYRTTDNDKKLQELVRSKYTFFAESPEAKRWYRRGAAILALVALLTLSPVAAVGALIVFVMSFLTWRLTDKGLDLRRYLEGLRMYIKAAETDRIKMLQSPEGAEKVRSVAKGTSEAQLVKLYEKVLPYAVLFGQEKEWNKQLGTYYEQTGTQPDWYTGHAAFNAAAFASGMNGIAQAASYSSSSSSSSGGSSGGGSSGGGGGGGGGGGV